MAYKILKIYVPTITDISYVIFKYNKQYLKTKKVTYKTVINSCAYYNHM